VRDPVVSTDVFAGKKVRREKKKRKNVKKKGRKRKDQGKMEVKCLQYIQKRQKEVCEERTLLPVEGAGKV
jgi:hypothetical protein